MRGLLLLDLDDTLYDERSYVLSGFRAVAEQLAAAEPIEAETAYVAMLEIFSAEGPGRIFDRVLERLGLIPDPDRVAQLVAIYRDHKPAIALSPDVAAALDNLAARFDLAIVTDGLAAMQRRKVEALGLERWARTIIYCWELDAAKPAIAGYAAALRQLGPDHEPCIVIGDNPAHDIAAAQALRLPSVRVRTGRFSAEPNPPGPAPMLDVSSLVEAAERLAKI